MATLQNARTTLPHLAEPPVHCTSPPPSPHPRHPHILQKQSTMSAVLAQLSEHLGTNTGLLLGYRGCCCDASHDSLFLCPPPRFYCSLQNSCRQATKSYLSFGCRTAEVLSVHYMIQSSCREGQGRAGQGRQGRAGQGRAGQGRAGQGRAGQGTTGARKWYARKCIFLPAVVTTNPRRHVYIVVTFKFIDRLSMNGIIHLSS